MKQMAYFGETNYQTMLTAREQLHNVLAPAATTIADSVPSFEGFVLFQQDSYHPDSAGAIAQFNATNVDSTRLAFQDAHVTNRRVDLDVSALGETFTTGRYELAESRMNPAEHLVAGIHIPELIGKRAASVFQLAFSRNVSEPSPDDLAAIYRCWQHLAPDCLEPLETLHEQAQLYPNHSVSDALELDVPTTPNAFLMGWDTSGSRRQAATNYGKLRSDLTLRGQRFIDIIERHGGTLMRPTGDGQMFALELPVDKVDRLSDTSIASFAATALTPLVRELLAASRDERHTPLRWTVDLGRIEHTTFDMSSPTIFEDASVSDRQPHDRTTVAFGNRALATLGLSTEQVDSLFA